MPSGYIKSLAVYLLLTAIPAAAVTVFIYSSISRTFSRQSAEHITETLEFVIKQLESESRELDTLLYQIQEKVSTNQDFVYELLIEKNENAPAIINMAGEIIHVYQLDMLDIADYSGKILSSGSWAANYGADIKDKINELGSNESRPFLFTDHIKGEEVLTLQACRSFMTGSKKMFVTGGYILTEKFLRKIGLSSRTILLLVYGAKIIKSHDVKELYKGSLFDFSSHINIAEIDVDDKPHIAGIAKIAVKGGDDNEPAFLISAVSEESIANIKADMIYKSVFIIFLACTGVSVLCTGMFRRNAGISSGMRRQI
ncbi:MAG: hypothetical protein ABIA63_14475 [bacterium]